MSAVKSKWTQNVQFWMYSERSISEKFRGLTDLWLKWICTFRTSCCKIKPGIWTLNPELCGSMLETIYSDRCQNLNSHFLTISSLKEEIYCSKKVDPWPCQFLKKNVEKRFFMYDMCFYVLSTLSNWAASWNMKGSFKHPYCPLLLGDLSGSHITLSIHHQ